MAGISSGMARRDSLMLGGNGLQQLQAFRWYKPRIILVHLVFRRDSFDPSRRDSLILAGESLNGSSRSFPVMEVEPWTPTPEVSRQHFKGINICFLVADVLDRLLERQFLLSPWVREKRLRNQLRLVLKVINYHRYHILLKK